MKRVGEILAVGLILIAASWVLILHSQGKSLGEIFSLEPRYDGHTFTYWTEHWRVNPWDTHPSAEAQGALNAMGPRAVPYLLNWIRQQPQYGSPRNYPDRALEGFKVLGPKAKSAIPSLIDEIDENSGYPSRALVAIGPEAVPALSAKLRETLADKSKPVMNWRDSGYKRNFYHVQVAILHCLSEMGTNAEPAIPVLLETVHANHPWRVPANPYQTLLIVGQNHPEIVFPALMKELTNSSLAFNRGAIAEALVSCGTNHADVLAPVLITALNDKQTDDWNRRSVAETLGVAGVNSDRAVPALMQAFTNTGTNFQDGIAEALGKLGNAARPALPLLSQASHSQNFHLRKSAAIAVKRIAPEETNSLVRLIADLKIREYRQPVIYALGSLGTNGQEAIPALMQCLSQPDTQARIDATRALNNIQVTSDDFIEALGENLTCTNYFMAQEAEETLARFAVQSRLAFVTLLKKGLCTEDIGRDERSQVKSALVNVSRENPKFLIDCLGDENVCMRATALGVFLDLERLVPAAWTKLAELKNGDPDPQVRSLAADAWRLQDAH